MNLIVLIVFIWAFCAILNKLLSRSREKAAQREMQRIREEQARQREAIRQREREAKEQAQKQAEYEKALARQRQEQERMKREQAKQAAQLAKHEAEIAKMSFQLDQANEDIENILWRIGEQQNYAVYLESERDKCSANSAEYFKWQKKLITVNNNIYQLEKQRRKAVFAAEQANLKLGQTPQATTTGGLKRFCVTYCENGKLRTGHCNAPSPAAAKRLFELWERKQNPNVFTFVDAVEESA